LGIEDLFAGMAGADMNGKGQYMGEGLFVVTIKTFKYKEGFKGKSIIVEFSIVESNNPAHGPGTTGSWVLKMDKPQWKGDVKALVLAATGKDPKSVGAPAADSETHAAAEQIAMSAISEEYAVKAGIPHDVLIGLPVRLETVKVKTQRGTDFTVHNWSPYTP
jgi:hypothetical protein